MRKSILSFTFFLLCGLTIFAQDSAPVVEEDIISVLRVTQGQGLPVVTDIIFIQEDKELIQVEWLVPDNEVSRTTSTTSVDETSISDNDFNAVSNVGFIEDKASRMESTENHCSEARVYPNPAKFYTNLVLPTRKTYDVYLLDILGKQKMHWTFSNTQNERLYLAEFQTGIYFLQLVCGSKTKTLRLKIVK